MEFYTDGSINNNQSGGLEYTKHTLIREYGINFVSKICCSYTFCSEQIVSESTAHDKIYICTKSQS